MGPNLIERSTAAYAYPLLIKHLLHTALIHAPEQEIIYRIAAAIPIAPSRASRASGKRADSNSASSRGQTVAVMDWDSHRYLECFFAVPMMGAMLQTVNIRLSPEQILYTLNHARCRDCSWSMSTSSGAGGDQGQARRRAEVHRSSTISGERPRTPISTRRRIRRTAGRRVAGFPLPRFRRECARHHVLHDRNDGRCRRASTSAIASSCCIPLLDLAAFGTAGRQGGFIATTCTCRSRRCSTSTPGACPMPPPLLGVKQVYPGRYAARHCC